MTNFHTIKQTFEMSCNCLLDRFPVELLHHLFNYFFTTEILYTFSDVSDYVKSVSLSYFQYKVNFRSIRRSDFDLVCYRLRPDEVVSLALSDDIDTPNQSQLFFSRFRIEQFKQLKSLTLIQIEIDSLKLIFTDLYQLHQLRSLSINIESITLTPWHKHN
jgi:hypothetical protein